MNDAVIWIAGFGDIGLRILQSEKQGNYVFHTISRAGKNAKSVNGQNITQHTVDFDKAELPEISGFEAAKVIYLAPPPPTGMADTRIEKFLSHYGSKIEKFVLISTTGVYGDCKGEWIDENCVPKPATPRAIRRLSAEQQVISWSSRYGRAHVILRVPGIYAQDRLPLARLRRGDPVIRKDQAPFTNRIHADDLATICLTVVESNRENLIVNVTDGNPLTMTEYFNAIADAVGLKRPPEIDLEYAGGQLSSGMLSYVRESRRIRNGKLLTEFPITLRYPKLETTLNTLKSSLT